jgi:hypothetical protein
LEFTDFLPVSLFMTPSKSSPELPAVMTIKVPRYLLSNQPANSLTIIQMAPILLTVVCIM